MSAAFYVARWNYSVYGIVARTIQKYSRKIHHSIVRNNILLKKLK